MPHGAIIGLTTSGKTTLGKHLAASFIKAGIRTLILHKPREPWPKECVWFQTADPEKYLEILDQVGKENYAKKSSGITDPRRVSDVCLMELADGIVDKYDSRFHYLYSAGRHDGHRCFYLSQRAAYVHPNIRENCESIYLFTVDWDAAKIWSTTFVDKALLKAPSLPPHSFMFKPNRYTPAAMKKLSLVGTK